MKHQVYGDLDEAKLIEGLTGEKGIYKRRGDKDPEVCALSYCLIEVCSIFQYYCVQWLENVCCVDFKSNTQILYTVTIHIED